MQKGSNIETFGNISVSEIGTTVHYKLTKKSKTIPWEDILAIRDVQGNRFLHYEEEGKKKALSISSNKKLKAIIDHFWLQFQAKELETKGELKGSSIVFGGKLGIVLSTLLFSSLFYLTVVRLCMSLMHTYNSMSHRDPGKQWMLWLVVVTVLTFVSLGIFVLSFIIFHFRNAKALKGWSHWFATAEDIEITNEFEEQTVVDIHKVTEVSDTFIKYSNEIIPLTGYMNGYTTKAKIVPYLLKIIAQKKGFNIPYVKRVNYSVMGVRFIVLVPLVFFLTLVVLTKILPIPNGFNFSYISCLVWILKVCWGSAIYFFMVELYERWQYPKKKKAFEDNFTIVKETISST